MVSFLQLPTTIYHTEYLSHTHTACLKYHNAFFFFYIVVNLDHVNEMDTIKKEETDQQMSVSVT